MIAVLILLAAVLAGCGSPPQAVQETQTAATAPAELITATVPSEMQSTTAANAPAETELTPAVPQELGLAPEDWMDWPVMPVVTTHVQEIYALGQELGRNPHAVSIFGDCQGLPEEFLGIYEIDAAVYGQLPLNLQETVDYFEGSLNRESPTVKPGTTTGALLWEDWHERQYGCQLGETPMDCEIRLNNPSFVLIAVGTHYETRNRRYMEIIIENLLENGIVPILSTKADNREGDHSINLQTAELAVEYNIPLWNFWKTTSHLPDNGLEVKAGEENLGKIYFNEEVIEIHRISALEMLDTIWRAVAPEE